MIGGGSQKSAQWVAKMLKLPFPVLADPDRAVYRRYGLDKVLLIIQRTATILVDKQGMVRYLHRATNPQAALEMEELRREIENLQEKG